MHRFGAWASGDAILMVSTSGTMWMMMAAHTPVSIICVPATVMRIVFPVNPAQHVPMAKAVKVPVWIRPVCPSHIDGFDAGIVRVYTGSYLSSQFSITRSSNSTVFSAIASAE